MNVVDRIDTNKLHFPWAFAREGTDEKVGDDLFARVEGIDQGLRNLTITRHAVTRTHPDTQKVIGADLPDSHRQSAIVVSQRSVDREACADQLGVAVARLSRGRGLLLSPS
jgi:hypothetical protein